MRKTFSNLLLAVVVASVPLTGNAWGQFGGTTSGGFGSGATGGFGTGGTGTGGFGTGNNSGFGTGGTGSNSFGSGFGAGSGAGTNTQGNSIFQPTTSAFGATSLGRTPFGAESNLRGPASVLGTGTTGRRTTGAAGTTGIGGLGGIGALGALGGIGGFGRNNRNTNLNQTNNQSTIRTRLSASGMREEMSAVPAVPATQVMARLERIPEAAKYRAVDIALEGNSAVVSGATLSTTDRNKLERLLLLEPGIDQVRFTSQLPEVLEPQLNN